MIRIAGEASAARRQKAVTTRQKAKGKRQKAKGRCRFATSLERLRAKSATFIVSPLLPFAFCLLPFASLFRGSPGRASGGSRRPVRPPTGSLRPESLRPGSGGG